jgi:hypothetical protein
MEIAELTTLLMDIRIDSELAAFIPPLQESERAGLEHSILTEGCRDPLVVWEETGILVDGHNRYAICTTHHITYTVKTLSFPNREAVFQWMIANQLSRRNLPPKFVSYLRGKQYLLEKQQGKRTDLTCGQFVHKSKTAQKLATEYGVNERTIRRDSDFAQQVDTITTTLGQQVRQEILSHYSPLTLTDIRKLAKVAKQSQVEAQSMYEQFKIPPKRSKSQTQPQEGVNYTPGQGCEYYVRLDEATWKRLRAYQEEVGTATLGGAVARLLDQVQSANSQGEVERLIALFSKN